MAPKQKFVIPDIGADAAAMEAKLAELKKAMEKERAKREAIAAKNGGSIWRSGAAAGPLRGNPKTKGPASAGGVGDPAGLGRSPRSGSEGSSTYSSPAAAAPQPRAPSARATEPADIPSVSGNRVAVQRPAPPPARKADILTLQGGPETGMGVGTESNSELMEGKFSEAESHRSFLEALEEWRRANKKESSEDVSSATAPARSQGGPGPGAEIEIQTDTRPKGRPTSAKMSYFDKLQLNNNSRQAAQLATGADTSERPKSSGPSFPASPAPPAGTPPPGLPKPPKPASASAAGTSRSPNASTEPPAEAPAAGSPEPEAAGAAVASDTGGAGPLSILDKLERLERQREQLEAAAEADDDGVAKFVVTTAHGVLTKGVRLPDEVLLPS